MSRGSQIKFLAAFKAEIELKGDKEGNAAQRLLYNRKATVFTVTHRALERAIEESLLKGIPLPPDPKHLKFAEDLIDSLSSDITAFISALTRKYEHPRQSGKSRVVESTATALIVAVFFLGGDVFKRIKGVYNVPLNRLFKIIKAKASSDLLAERRGSTFSLEHDHFMGILETTMQASLEAALTNPDSSDAKRGKADVLAWLKSQEVDIEIIRDGSKESMSVFLGSSVVNDREAKDVQRKKKKLLEVLEAALEKLQKNPAFSFMELKGSDSIMTTRRKKLIKNTTKQFKKQKHVKVTTENTDIKTSKAKKKESFGPKGVSATGLKRTSKVKKGNKAKKGSAGMPLAEMMTKFNAKITQEVMSNMQSPALVNRTGRFAESVRITDIVKTPRGLNSVGYTYQRNPYQTFEMGGAQGSPERDPRKIIDQSMREIAVSFAMGRFYTRRV
jgi:hypothetical protein